MAFAIITTGKPGRPFGNIQESYHSSRHWHLGTTRMLSFPWCPHHHLCCALAFSIAYISSAISPASAIFLFTHGFCCNAVSVGCSYCMPDGILPGLFGLKQQNTLTTLPFSVEHRFMTPIPVLNIDLVHSGLPRTTSATSLMLHAPLIPLQILLITHYRRFRPRTLKTSYS